MSYLETCLEAAANIDPSQLETLTPGEISGYGSQVIFRPLGRLVITKGNIQWTGLKIIKRHENAQISTTDRLRNDIASIGLYVSRSPELLVKVPSFTCRVKVDGTNRDAILTEDASEGGTKIVRHRKASQETRQLLYEPFREKGDMDYVLDQEVLDMTTAFDAGGSERLLDFSPDPVEQRILYDKDVLAPYLIEIEEMIDNLTITIPTQSILGKALI